MPLSGLFPLRDMDLVEFLYPLKTMINTALILPSLDHYENCICVMILSKGLV